jgi:hypothetical protein
MQQDRGPKASRGADLDLCGRVLGHGCIVLAVCLVAALIFFPTGW